MEERLGWLGNAASSAFELNFVAADSDSFRLRDVARLVSADDVGEEGAAVRVIAALHVVADVVHLLFGDPLLHGTAVFQVLDEQMQAAVSSGNQLLTDGTDELLGEKMKPQA